MCGEGWKIREAYRKTQTPAAKAALAEHIRTCPTCHIDAAAVIAAVTRWEYDDAAIEAAYRDRRPPAEPRQAAEVEA